MEVSGERLTDGSEQCEEEEHFLWQVFADSLKSGENTLLHSLVALDPSFVITPLSFPTRLSYKQYLLLAQYLHCSS